MNFSSMRREYTQKPISKTDLDPNPFSQFKIWAQEAIQAKVPEPNAMSLATSSKFGFPSIRTVLLKGFDDNGLVFYTNYNSSKSKDIEENPHVALLFLWLSLERQVRIQGTAEKMSQTENEAYFQTRPIETQLGAWSSDQSQIIDSKKSLEQKVKDIRAKYEGKQIPMPPFWGGYRVVPTSFEFWQGQPNRLHDRLHYRQTKDGWIVDRLCP